MQDIKMPSGSLDSTMMSFSNWPYDVRSTFAQVAMRELHLPSQTQEKNLWEIQFFEQNKKVSWRRTSEGTWKQWDQWRAECRCPVYGSLYITI